MGSAGDVLGHQDIVPEASGSRIAARIVSEYGEQAYDSLVFSFGSDA